MNRLRAERGMALPLALGIILALTVTVVTLLEFTSSSSRGASLNVTRQSAKALAEGGVNEGASVLAKQLSIDAGYTDTPSGTAVIQGTNVPWTTTLISSSPRTWVVSATAALQNPTGPGAAAVPRTVSAKFTWTSSPNPSVWRGLTLFDQGNVPLMSDDDASIVTPVYVKGDVKITQGKFLGNSFQVYGHLTLEGFRDVTSIGASTRTSGTGITWKPTFPEPLDRTEHRVADFRVKDGCTISGGGGCGDTSATGGPSGKMWLAPGAFSSTVENIDEPVVDFTTVRNTAHLRPGQGCQTSTGSPPSFSSTGDIQLMTSSSYTCRRDTTGDGVPDGEISWTTGTPGTLTVKGIIYFDGNIKQDTDNRWGKVSGKAIMYSNGFVLLKGVNSGLCGVVTATQPECDNSAGVWEPNTTNDFLVLIAKSSAHPAIDQTDFRYQGGLMAPNGGYLLQGDATFKGAVTVDKAEIKNEGVIDAWSPFTAGTEIPGLPGSINKLSFVPGSWSS